MPVRMPACERRAMALATEEHPPNMLPCIKES